MIWTEIEIKNKVVEILSKYFFVYEEITSQCGKSRIDLIVVCRRSSAKFGIELKKIDKKTGSDIGDLIIQARRYSISKFRVNTNDKHERIPIFIYPPISHHVLMCPDKMLLHEGEKYFKDRHSEDNDHHTANGMLGKLGIGELRKIKFWRPYFAFIYSNFIIWSTKPKFDYINYRSIPNGDIHGLHEENYKRLIKSINYDGFSI